VSIDAEMEYVLLVEPSSPRPTQKIGRVVAQELARPLPDVNAEVRYGGGLIAKGLSWEQSVRVTQALHEIGVHVRPLDAHTFLPAPRGRRITSLYLSGEVLRAGMVSGQEITIDRDLVFGLDVFGLLPAKDELTSATSDEQKIPRELSSLTARAKELLEKLTEHEIPGMEFHLTIYCAGPIGPLRVRRNEFNYVGLGEEKLEHSLDNFLLLLERTTQEFPQVWNREKAVDFLASLDPSAILYYKREEVQNFDRWMMHWICIGYEEEPPDTINGDHSADEPVDGESPDK